MAAAGIIAGGRAARKIHWIAAPVALLLGISAWTAARAQVPEFPDSLVNRQWVVARTERYEATHTTSLVGDYIMQRGLINGIVRTNMLTSTTLLDNPATRDQVDLLADLEYNLPSSMRLFFHTEGTLTNDVQRNGLIPGINNTAASFVGVGGRVTDKNGNRIGIAAGGTYNRQLNVEDAGGAIYSEVAGRFDWEGYQVELDGKGRWYNIAPRHNSNAYLDLHVARAFEEGATGDFRVRYEFINTDLYIKRSEEDLALYQGLTYEGLRARGEGRLQVNALLSYPIDDDLGLDISLQLADQRIGQEELTEGLPPLPRDPEPFRFDRSDFSIGSVVEMHWRPSRLAASLRLDYFTNEQFNRVDPRGIVSDAELARRRASSAQSDFITQQLMLAGSGAYRISRHDTLSMNGSVSIYRYDTPSLTNYFDRDEQSIQGEIRYARTFSPVLGFSIYGQVFLTHLVYLFGQNSNDNNWNRIFRLAPAVHYHLGKDFQNYFEAEVLANYTEYDFEGRTQNIRGRSFRELRIRDSVEIGLTGSLRLMAFGDLRVSERGSFSWSQFAESPIERTRTEGLAAEMFTSAIDGVWFGVGGRLSRVKTFRAVPRSTVLEPFSDRTSVGPTARFEARLSERSIVEFTGWWEHRFEESRLVGRLPLLFLTVRMRL